MAISYPLNTPTGIGIAEIELIATDAVAVSRSPFTFATQVHSYGGEMWSANVTIPPVRKDLAEPWVAFLTALRGQYGTFLLGDPNNTAPRSGNVSALSISSPSIGDRTLTANLTGNLSAGDFIQLGTGIGSRLHKVLQDVSSGAGVSIDIWPAVRAVTTTVSYTNAKGVFRLASNERTWGINSSSVYGIQFSAMEYVSA